MCDNNSWMQARLPNVSGDGLGDRQLAERQNNLINPRRQLTGFCVWWTRKGLLGVCLEKCRTNEPVVMQLAGSRTAWLHDPSSSPTDIICFAPKDSQSNCRLTETWSVCPPLDSTESLKVLYKVLGVYLSNIEEVHWVLKLHRAVTLKWRKSSIALPKWCSTGLQAFKIFLRLRVFMTSWSWNTGAPTLESRLVLDSNKKGTKLFFFPLWIFLLKWLISMNADTTKIQFLYVSVKLQSLMPANKIQAMWKTCDIMLHLGYCYTGGCCMRNCFFLLLAFFLVFSPAIKDSPLASRPATCVGLHFCRSAVP